LLLYRIHEGLAGVQPGDSGIWRQARTYCGAVTLGLLDEIVEPFRIDPPVVSERIDVPAKGEIIRRITRKVRRARGAPLHVSDGLELLAHLAGCFIGRLLHLRVDGGVDTQAISIQVIAPLLGPLT